MTNKIQNAIPNQVTSINSQQALLANARSNIFSHFTKSPIKPTDKFNIKNPAEIFYAILFGKPEFEAPKTHLQKWIFESVFSAAKGVTKDEEVDATLLLEPDSLIRDIGPINAIFLIGTGLQLAHEMLKRGPSKDLKDYETSVRLFEETLDKLVNKYPNVCLKINLASFTFNNDTIHPSFEIKLEEIAKEKQLYRRNAIIKVALGALFLGAAAFGVYKYFTSHAAQLDIKSEEQSVNSLNNAELAKGKNTGSSSSFKDNGGTQGSDSKYETQQQTSFQAEPAKPELPSVAPSTQSDSEYEAQTSWWGHVTSQMASTTQASLQEFAKPEQKAEVHSSENIPFVDTPVIATSFVDVPSVNEYSEVTSSVIPTRETTNSWKRTTIFLAGSSLFSLLSVCIYRRKKAAVYRPAAAPVGIPAPALPGGGASSPARSISTSSTASKPKNTDKKPEPSLTPRTPPRGGAAPDPDCVDEANQKLDQSGKLKKKNQGSGCQPGTPGEERKGESGSRTGSQPSSAPLSPVRPVEAVTAAPPTPPALTVDLFKPQKVERNGRPISELDSTSSIPDAPDMNAPYIVVQNPMKSTPGPKRKFSMGGGKENKAPPETQQVEINESQAAENPFLKTMRTSLKGRRQSLMSPSPIKKTGGSLNDSTDFDESPKRVPTPQNTRPVRRGTPPAKPRATSVKTSKVEAKDPVKFKLPVKAAPLKISNKNEEKTPHQFLLKGGERSTASSVVTANKRFVIPAKKR